MHSYITRSIAGIACRTQDFLRNNRGINDGADLPEDYMGRLYDSIVSDEIKMKVTALTHVSPMVCTQLVHQLAPEALCCKCQLL